MNPNLVRLCLAGGLFAILTLNHFTVDFIFQTHWEAMNKHANWRIRTLHCTVYTVGFLPVLWLLHRWSALTVGEVLASLAILFCSHHVQDTYVSVVWWAKHIRRVPEMQYRIGDGHLYRNIYTQKELDRAGFLTFIGTPLGKLLMVAIDQIIHLSFLLPICWMAVS